ncbi:hypothetical protein Tco_0619810 [Tanacetum coccineum]
MLLEDAKTEYGHNSNGPLSLPCDVDLFYKVLAEMEANDAPQLGWGFAYGSCSPFNTRHRVHGAQYMGKDALFVLAEMEANDASQLGWGFAYGSCSPFNTRHRVHGAQYMDKEDYEGVESRQIHLEEEDKEQCSPVLVLDPLFEDDEEEHDVGAVVEDGYDLECCYSNVQMPLIVDVVMMCYTIRSAASGLVLPCTLVVSFPAGYMVFLLVAHCYYWSLVVTPGCMSVTAGSSRFVLALQTYKVNAAEGVNAASEEVSTAELESIVSRLGLLGIRSIEVGSTVILFSIHSDDGNPSSVNIKQHCGRSYALSWKPYQVGSSKLNLPDHRYKRRCCSLIPAESDSLPHAHAQAFKVTHSAS